MPDPAFLIDVPELALIFEVAREGRPRRLPALDVCEPQADWDCFVPRPCSVFSGVEASDDCHSAKVEGVSKLMGSDHDLFLAGCFWEASAGRPDRAACTL